MEAGMDCPKCKGLVVREWVPEALEEEYQLRCVNCSWSVPIAPTKTWPPDIESWLKGCCCSRKDPEAAT
jgi:hypothetical protein